MRKKAGGKGGREEGKKSGQNYGLASELRLCLSLAPCCLHGNHQTSVFNNKCVVGVAGSRKSVLNFLRVPIS